MYVSTARYQFITLSIETIGHKDTRTTETLDQLSRILLQKR